MNVLDRISADNYRCLSQLVNFLAIFIGISILLGVLVPPFSLSILAGFLSFSFGCFVVLVILLEIDKRKKESVIQLKKPSKIGYVILVMMIFGGAMLSFRFVVLYPLHLVLSETVTREEYVIHLKKDGGRRSCDNKLAVVVSREEWDLRYYCATPYEYDFVKKKKARPEDEGLKRVQVVWKKSLMGKSIDRVVPKWDYLK